MERLALLEVLDRDGRVRQAVEVTHWPVRVGRSLECEVVLDDPHVAAEHLLLAPADPPGRVSLRAGETLNGVRCGRLVLRRGQETVRPAGEEWWVGQTRLRVRLAGQAVPAELPLPATGRGPLLGLAAALLGVLAWTAWTEYLQSDPGELWGPLSGALLGVLALLALWSFLWALGTKLFQHRLDYWRHLRIAATGLLTSGVLAAGLGVLAFATSWVGLGRASGMAEAAVLAATVWAHLGVVLPARRHALAWAVGSALLAGLVVTAAFQYQRTGRLWSELYRTVLPPPSWRLAPAVDPQDFLQEVRGMKASLDRAARERDEDPAGVDDVEAE